MGSQEAQEWAAIARKQAALSATPETRKALLEIARRYDDLARAAPLR
jgi:hypothetical protein